MTMEEKIDKILLGVTELKESVARLEERVTRLEESVARLEERVTRLEERVTKLEEDVKELKEDVKKLKDDVKELKESHINMNRNIILIQEDTSTKIPALFDGYSFHQQHIEQNDKRLDFLEDKVENHSIRLWALEKD